MATGNRGTRIDRGKRPGGLPNEPAGRIRHQWQTLALGRIRGACKLIQVDGESDDATACDQRKAG
jgi:hypothetical protein